MCHLRSLSELNFGVCVTQRQCLVIIMIQIQIILRQTTVSVETELHDFVSRCVLTQIQRYNYGPPLVLRHLCLLPGHIAYIQQSFHHCLFSTLLHLCDQTINTLDLTYFHSPKSFPISHCTSRIFICRYIMQNYGNTLLIFYSRYIDGGRNPQLYTKDCMEKALTKNEQVRNIQNLKENFRILKYSTVSVDTGQHYDISKLHFINT